MSATTVANSGTEYSVNMLWNGGLNWLLIQRPFDDGGDWSGIANLFEVAVGKFASCNRIHGGRWSVQFQHKPTKELLQRLNDVVNAALVGVPNYTFDVILPKEAEALENPKGRQVAVVSEVVLEDVKKGYLNTLASMDLCRENVTEAQQHLDDANAQLETARAEYHTRSDFLRWNGVDPDVL